MKYQKQVDIIRKGKMSRSDLGKLKKNAEVRFNQGDLDAKYVIDEINTAIPADQYIIYGILP